VANLNRIILVGRLTADLESRSTMDGIPMAKFRLAVGRPQGGDDFFDIIAWRREAENLGGKVQKDTMLLVEGRIQIRSFEDQSGQRRWVTEVVARNVQILDQAKVSGPVSSMPESEIIDEASLADDLPF